MPGVKLTDQPWWTDADQADLDLLTWEFVNAVQQHRERCPECAAGGPWCQPLVDAFQAVLDWRQGRILFSRAAFHRAHQDIQDALEHVQQELRAVNSEQAAAA